MPQPISAAATVVKRISVRLRENFNQSISTIDRLQFSSRTFGGKYQIFDAYRSSSETRVRSLHLFCSSVIRSRMFCDYSADTADYSSCQQPSIRQLTLLTAQTCWRTLTWASDVHSLVLTSSRALRRLPVLKPNVKLTFSTTKKLNSLTLNHADKSKILQYACEFTPSISTSVSRNRQSSDSELSLRL
jgi:hypothetical protein